MPQIRTEHVEDGRDLSGERAEDGRVLRGERNREAIVDALYHLIRAGAPQPTARQVAERAGVQPRTVFRHFQDMASLNAELSARVAAEVRPLLERASGEGNLDERVRTTARARADAFERLAPFERSSRALRSRLAFVQEAHERTVRELRRDLQRALPETTSMSAEDVAALEMLFSFEAWERLRVDQSLTREQALRVVEHAALAVLAPVIDPGRRKQPTR